MSKKYGRSDASARCAREFFGRHGDPETVVADCFNSAADGIMIVDKDGRIRTANSQAAKIFRYPLPESLIGEPVEKLVPQEARHKHKQACPRFFAAAEKRRMGVGEHLGLTGLTADGARVPIDVGLGLFKTGRQPYVIVTIRDITDLKSTEESLRDSEQRFRGAFDHAAIGMAIVGLDGRWLKVNKSLCEIVGRSAEELYLMTFQDITHPDDLELDLNLVRRLLAGQIDHYHLEKRYLHKDGHVVWILLSVSLVRNGSGRPVHFVSQIQDTSERHLLEAQLQRTNERFSGIFNASKDAIAFTSLEDATVDFNPAYARLTGYPHAELRQKSTQELIPPEHRYIDMARMEELLETGRAVEFETEFEHRRGRRVPVQITAFVVRDPDGRPIGLAKIIKDITERKQAEATIAYMAYHDTLTGLANRRLFEDRFRQAAAQAKRNSDLLGLLFIDIDQFKRVNDALGHEVGDELLRLIAGRLTGVVRAVDLVARMGGDEFCIILTATGDANAVLHAVKRIMAIFEKPLTVADHTINVTVSVGISIFPENGESIKELTNQADAALLRAKKHPGNSYEFFTDSMQLQTFERLALEEALHGAIDRGELSLCYQPFIQLQTGRICGAEALMRWHRGGDGSVPPSRFIPIAEETGLILKLGDWILAELAAQFADFSEPRGDGLVFSINLSAGQLQYRKLLDSVRQTKASLGRSTTLQIEVTETAIMKESSSTFNVLRGLKALGVRIAIDDFGTGYSSLRYLRDFPIDALKIDVSFVKRITSNQRYAAIVNAIVGLGRTLDLRVTAEGVETRNQLDILRSFGCTEFQGFLFSKPLPVDGFKELIGQDRAFPTA